MFSEGSRTYTVDLCIRVNVYTYYSCVIHTKVFYDVTIMLYNEHSYILLY